MVFNYWFSTVDALIILVAIISLLGIVQGVINHQNAKVIREFDLALERLRKILGDIK